MIAPQNETLISVKEADLSNVVGSGADYVLPPKLGQVCRVTRTIKRDGKTTTENAYLITSLSPEQASAKKLLELNRGHWAIENRLHWVRDVTFGEDASQTRVGSIPQNVAAMRNVAISAN